MTWLVLPVKSIAEGKSRLAPDLAPDRRRQLNLELLERALALAARYPGAVRTLVASRCPEVLALARRQGAGWIAEKQPGLNEAVAQAFASLATRAGEQVLVMSCDLPLAREDDLRMLVRPGEATIASDRTGTGTNVLCLPAGAPFRFHYGPMSRERHAAQALRLGLPCRVVQTPSLAFDLDTLDDYREWQKREATVPA
ncbi:2-phospho-L-lactate guanylyltransferase [Variovorax defluvii]|uniref:2-phospho-L-lactate guanylyltransferase n=1 Tax=Variovorax defluvii TaxID=913761 RepID=A0ABP8I8P1_9BURK